MGDTLATMQDIRDRLVMNEAKVAAAWAAKYPYSMMLDDKHYVWDRDFLSEDLSPRIEEWLAEHVGEDFGIRRRVISFKDADAAFAFRMRWA